MSTKPIYSNVPTPDGGSPNRSADHSPTRGPSSPRQYEVYQESASCAACFNGIIESKGWRWIVGRISCLVRIPIYAAYATAQVAKIILKLPLAIPAIIVGAIVNSQESAFALKGLAKDVLLVVSLVDKLVNSLICFIVAPPKNYHSLGDVLITSNESVVGGNYHKYTLDEVLAKTFRFRADWVKTLTSPGSPVSDRTREFPYMKVANDLTRIPNDIINRIKAG